MLQVLPPLPARRAELAGEIKALDVVGVFATLAAIMLGDQRRQRDRGALALRLPGRATDLTYHRVKAALSRGGQLSCRLSLRSREPGDGFPCSGAARLGVEQGNEPGIGEPGGADATVAARPDEQLKPASAVLGGGERRRGRRRHGDVAAIALAGIEDAEPASCPGAEVERVFDDPAERACLDRERVAPLIAPRDGGAVARRGMVVLVIGQLFAGSEVALGGAARIAVDRADSSEDRPRLRRGRRFGSGSR